MRPAPERQGPRVVSLGGGHGLAVSLTALRRVTDALTAVVTAPMTAAPAGRLRRDLACCPPATCAWRWPVVRRRQWGATWSRVVQHRFRAPGDLHNHAVGNVLIVALWSCWTNPVAGLDWGVDCSAPGAGCAMASVPLDITAAVARLTGRAGSVTAVRGSSPWPQRRAGW